MAERSYRFEFRDGEKVVLQGFGELPVHTGEWVRIGDREYKVRRVLHHINLTTSHVVTIYEI